MERMSGLDATFLYLETPSLHTHVVGVVVLDTTTVPGGYSYERLYEVFRQRLSAIPAFRRRVLFVPLDLDHPVRIDDPDFDLDAHLFRVAVRPPGTMHELAEIVGDFASRPLDRSRPLWEAWIVEGLEDGRVALVTKVHHSAIDGVSGVDVMATLFDLEPDAPEPDAPEPESPADWQPDQVPSSWKLMRDAVRDRVMHPTQALRQVGNVASSLFDMARTTLTARAGERRSPLMINAPRTRWTGALTPHRTVAFGEVPLEDLKIVKDAFGAKVNDVVLAACTQSLRRYLIEHDDLPDRPLVAYCPVSIRGEDGARGSNQFTTMAVKLPVQIDDPVEQLRAIADDTHAAKELTNAAGVSTLQDVAQFMPPTLFNLAMRFYSGMRLADYHPPIQNAVISNVPGPPIPLYCAGASVDAVYPFGPLIEGAGLNITVLSNMGKVDVGVIACRETVPDVWDMTEGFDDAVAALKQAAQSETEPEATAPVSR